MITLLLLVNFVKQNQRRSEMMSEMKTLAESIKKRETERRDQEQHETLNMELRARGAVVNDYITLTIKQKIELLRLLRGGE